MRQKDVDVRGRTKAVIIILKFCQKFGKQLLLRYGIVPDKSLTRFCELAVRVMIGWLLAKHV